VFSFFFIIFVEFTVNDQKGNPVANGTLTVTVEGKEYTVDVVDGKATFKDITLPDTPGNYSYHVSYSGEGNYNPSVGQLNLTVQKVDVFVTLPEVINYTGAVVDIVVDVIDEYGNPVNEGTVNLVIDFGTKLSNKLMATALSNTAEVSEGKAVFKDVKLENPGTYKYTVTYSRYNYNHHEEGINDYLPSEADSKLNILPLNTTTTSEDVSGTVGDKKDITTDIVDQNGDPVQNGTAVLKVNGKELTIVREEEANKIEIVNLIFKGKNNEILESFQMKKGSSPFYPIPIIYNDYSFFGWDKQINYLNENTIITGTYTKILNNKYTGKKISILGDSISTFEGYIPNNYKSFYPASYGDVRSIFDTWWMQVINGLGAQLFINNAYGGSTVCNFDKFSTSNDNRLQTLSINGKVSDVLLIFMGIQLL